jgi:hypothetical protein
VCLLLALVLGPARIDSRYGSFGWLVVGSLGGGLLVLRLRVVLLILVGLGLGRIQPLPADLFAGGQHSSRPRRST